MSLKVWIPAYAGMTDVVVHMPSTLIGDILKKYRYQINGVLIGGLVTAVNTIFFAIFGLNKQMGHGSNCGKSSLQYWAWRCHAQCHDKCKGKILIFEPCRAFHYWRWMLGITEYRKLP